MLEGIVADVLVRVLGSYVDGLNKDSIRLGVWSGDLELKHLRLRPDALAVLFETLGLDLPVTVTAGYIGLLRLEVPWKALRSAPVRIYMHDVTVVASPVSDGDQAALELREKRLKAARLATDEAVRDAKFSLAGHQNASSSIDPPSDGQGKDGAADGKPPAGDGSRSQSGYRVARWGWNFTSKVVTKIVDNIQIDVENVVVQYEDASSVRDRPYTATIALDSLRACSTNHVWEPVFIENPSSPVVHKVLYMRGLVLNWEPGNANNSIKGWILDAEAQRIPGQWSGFVRKCSRHAIKPIDGELRISLTKSAALAAALAGKDENYLELRKIPRVQMDLHFPEVQIILDDFQYHTLLSTIMYLSDIDRKVRPKTARGRWFWALDRLLPRFKERREAVLRFNATGLRERRKKREDYCRARNIIVTSRRKGSREPETEAKIVEELEADLSYRDVILFRDLADRDLIAAAKEASASAVSTSRFWSLFSRQGRDSGAAVSTASSDKGTSERSRSRNDGLTQPSDGAQTEATPSGSLRTSFSERQSDDIFEMSNEIRPPSQESSFSEALSKNSFDEGEEATIPNFRMGFLLGKGSIELKEGGFPDAPMPVSSLEFGELRIGIETRPGAGMLLEALLGTFQVIDLQKQMKVMYPRAPWAGETKTTRNGLNEDSSLPARRNSDQLMSDLADDWAQSQKHSENVETFNERAKETTGIEVAHLHSYPHDISNAICEIRGEYGLESEPLPATSPSFPTVGQFKEGFGSDSSGSISALSDGGISGVSVQNIEDLSVVSHTPLKYIAALRLNHEEAPQGQWASGATRMAMDLAIGGMEVLVDGPKGAFVSSVAFWHPREKMPSIMQFLSRAAAPRLASLRMDIQKAILDRSVPMRMDMLIRGPRFVVPGSSGGDVSLVLDLGTFAMETSTGPSEVVSSETLASNCDSPMDMPRENSISIRYTDYKMAVSDLGLFVVSKAGKQAAERIIRPFSVHVLLQVLHNSSFVEAVTHVYGKIDIAKVKLRAQMPSLRTSVSHDAFRQILGIAKGWGDRAPRQFVSSGIEPNPVSNSISMSAELEEVRFAHGGGETVVSNGIVERSESALISFEMSLDFEDLQLELRDSGSKRVVTLSSTGTMIKLLKRPELVDFDFRVRTFAIIDGSRGATAPFRRLAYAGMNHYGSGLQASDSAPEDSFAHGDQTTFIVLSYRGDLVNHEQSLAVKILSLHMVCVRETYFALADFFYLNKNKIQTPESSYRASHVSHAGDAQQFAGTDRAVRGGGEANSDDVVYSDPFNALGMTTSSAAKALREQAERRMEQTKQAIANRGRLHVTADLDGLNLTLVSADGAIGSFDVTNCRVGLTQFSNGAIEASGNLGGFGVQDLTSAHEVYSETIRYTRREINPNYGSEEGDGWSLSVPESETEDVWLEARLTNLRIVYLQRFIIILKKYFDALRDSLKPVLEMKGGIGEVFQGEEHEEFPAIPRLTGRMRLKLVTENVDIVMPRHSQSPYEALRFFVPHSSISNEDRPSPGYRIGFQVNARDVNAHVLYRPPAEGEGRALTLGGKEPVLQQISPTCPISDLTPFAEGICIVAKLDAWRSRRVPQVILNTDGIPVLKDGEEEREYDPAKWLPTIRVRVCAPNGIYARLCEAEYSILYFTFTENVIERPDIEFTDIVRGLKTPVLPRRKPVQPIMFSSNRMPANYQILFEVPVIESTIMYGADPRAEEAKLIKSELRDLLGCFEYGVDYRMSVEVSANMNSLVDIRPSAPTYGETLVMPTTRKFEQFSNSYDGDIKPQEDSSGNISEDNRSIALTWDRPFGFRANVMVVASDLRIIVEPELFRDLGNLTAPGFPFLKSSAPAPLLRFNGRLLILTISRPEVWLMANQYPGDARSLVIRGDVIAKVQWAAVTGRNRVEVAANGIHVNLSILGPHRSAFPVAPSSPLFKRSSSSWNTDVETPMLYPCDVSMKFDGSGYDPPKTPGEEPIKAPGSTLSVNAESILVRIDVNDAPLILAVGSRLVRLQSSVLSVRPPQPGRFDEWIDKGEEGDARLAIHFALPHSRLMFTDETAGRYVPIMEARLRNAVLRSNFPWLLNAAFEFALDLFNEEKGWWEPGIETFPIEFAASQGRSGSRAVNVRAERVIDINVTPITVSGAARVSNALKSAIEDLASRMRAEVDDRGSGSGTVLSRNLSSSFRAPEAGARRPSVAAFSVRNETGRSLVMWLLHDSTRWTLRGNGDEREVDTPTDEMLWTAIGASGGLSSDPNKNRQLAMRCVLLFSGYEAVTLSTAETGARLVTLVPDTRELGTLPSGNRGELTSQTFVWAVSMKHGVPCGCIRSLLRLVNKTSTVLEVNAGDLSKSASAGEQMKSLCARGSEGVDRKATVLLKAGASWSVPVHSVNRSIRIRPAIFHAPDNDMGLYEDNDRRPKARGRVRYSYTWSDPLSKMSALHTIAQSLRSKARTGSDGELKTHGPIAPILTCRKAEARGFFCMSIFPLVDTKAESPIDWGSGVGSWVDVHICPPLVIENIMPRRLSFKLATSGAISASGKEQVVGYGTIEPSREAHIHTAGSDLNALSISMGFDNSPQASETNIFSHSPPHRSFGTYHPNLASLRSISMGAGKYTPLKLSLIQEQRVNTRYVRAYCEFWIRNRSDTDLFFRNHGPGRDGYESGSPKAFLRGCPPGTVAEKFICFSGSWMSFQRVDVTEDIWVNIGTEVSEIDKPVPIKFDGLSLFLEVRPAKGRFQRALVVTIRNAAWLENRTGALLQWCQPEALNPHGIALAAKVHSIEPDKHCALHCDFRSHKTALCFRRATADGLSDWIWSRPVFVTGVEGEFAAKMYRPKRHEQYIARVVVSKIGNGVSSIIVHKEDRSTPPYRIVNLCNARSIAFRQSGVNETHPWLVRPGKSTRYSWDDPQAPVKRRSLVIEVLEGTSGRDGAGNVTLLATSEADSAHADESDVTRLQGGLVRKPKGAKASKFDLNIDIIRKDIPFSNSKRFDPPLCISVHVDGPTKVVTFRDGEGKASKSTKQIERGEVEDSIEVAANSKSYGPSDTADASGNVDVELFVKGLGISFVESTPAELAYLSVSGIHFRLDRFDGQQLVICEVMDLQLDNQLSHCTWPVVLWSPPPPSTGVIGRMTERAKDGMSSSQTTRREPPRKPFFQFTLHGQYPAIEQRIGSFRGIFVALQELQLAADEDFVLRVWLFVVSLLEAAGGSNREREEALDGKDGAETGLALLANDNATTGTKQRAVPTKGRASGALNRIYVEHLELCPLKLSVSFTSSRTSSAAEHIGGFRSLIRTLVAVLGNVENAEFRFNALELQHVFDTASHFRSLITEYYVSQGSNQKMVLLASNSLIGNPSALFDSIAIGTRDFFVEPANAKGSADFIASIGRGSSSLLTNTVGGIVGSLGGIPRAVAQGLETAVGDREYLAERDSIRGGRARIASSPAQGLYTGALSFGHGIASGAAGLIRDPIQGAAEEGPSGFIKGLGKGFIGGMLKPITGALDLIAEPAAGFRSMMVSDRSHGLAEPARPPRAFWGANADQMISYDLRAALGHAILRVVNSGENQSNEERLLSWTHLVAVHSGATEDDVIAFLWALMRRSTRSSHFHTKYLLDAQGNPQRAEKMRAGLVTNKRLIVASLDGHVIWEYPLLHIADTQVSVAAKDYLMVGIRPLGQKSRTTAPTGWQKIHCGSISSRNDFNTALRKALDDLRITTKAVLPIPQNILLAKKSAAGQGVREHYRDGSLELADLSNSMQQGTESGNMYELKSLHQDASVDGRRGVFTDMKLPGRSSNTVRSQNMSLTDQDISLQLQKIANSASAISIDAARSVRLIVVNLTEHALRLVCSSLDSGAWVQKPTSTIEKRSVSLFEADGTADRAKDISGRIVMQVGTDGGKSGKMFIIRFLNPLLASNAYAVEAPAEFVARFQGGEKGNHVETVITLASESNLQGIAVSKKQESISRKAPAEPLLFGRSQVSPFLLPLNSKPPHAPQNPSADPRDPELIAKLSSLGFSSEESMSALEECDADLAAAYALLLDRKPKE